MARRMVSSPPSPLATQEPKPVLPDYSLMVDIVAEAAIVGTCANDPLTFTKTQLKLRSEHFQSKHGRSAWEAMIACRRKGMGVEKAAILAVSDEATEKYIEQCKSYASLANLQKHIANVLWDFARATVSRGPVRAFLEAITDMKAEPELVVSRAKQIVISLQNTGDRPHLLRPDALVTEAMREVEQRVDGHAVYSYGVSGLDAHDDFRPRMVPGTAPGLVTVVTGISGGGKALALSTPIATPNGWSTMGELQVNDLVFSDDGTPTRVIACSQIMRGRPCFEIEFSDGHTIVADAEHLWRTSTAFDRLRGLKNVRSTRDLYETQKCTSRNANNHSIEVAAPLELDEAKLTIDPYLLGVWLGDGTSQAGYFTKADVEIAERIRTRGNECVKTNVRLRWNVPGLITALRALGLKGNKHIPREYLRASFEQRLELLRGLMDTDGCCTVEGKCNFDTTNINIRDGVQELLISLGIKARFRERDAKLYGRVISKSWRFVFCTDLAVFTLPRKLERMREHPRGVHRRRYIVRVSITASMPVRCVQVAAASAMFLAGRGMIPTHNSTFAANMALGIAFEGNDYSRDAKGRSVLFGAWEMRPSITLESLAMTSLGWGRELARIGKGHIATPEGRQTLLARMSLLAERIRFLELPFSRQPNEKKIGSNDRNLDLIHGYLADCGCEVFIADLWERCLRETMPDDVSQALYRQQAMLQETRVHGILLQQMRFKDVELRKDKRPTRESLKGTGAWVEVADCVLGVHWPYLHTGNEMNTLELYVLKQRYGRWPLAVEFEYNPDSGSIARGKDAEYKRESDNDLDAALAPGQQLRSAYPRRSADKKPERN
jgi:replicative DNA helicase